MIRYVSLLLLLHAATPQAGPVVDIAIGNTRVIVETAVTPDELTHGLMGRKHLGESSGMLFIFPTTGYYSMWMYHTLIPLSVAFLDKNGRICCRAPKIDHLNEVMLVQN